ncbi:CHAT domain-containing protein [bacterium]|nr:CHAT domain-containing protein [bacterium]
MKHRKCLIVISISVILCTGPILPQTVALSVVNDTTAARLFSEKAMLFLEKIQYDSALLDFEYAGRLYEQAARKSGCADLWAEYVYCVAYKGHILYLKAKYTEALQCLEGVLDTALEKLGASHIETASIYNKIGNVYLKTDFNKALGYYEKTLEIRQMLLGERHPEVAKACNNIGLVYEYQDNFLKALDYYSRSLNIIKTTGDSLSLTAANAYYSLSTTSRRLGNFDKALHYCFKSLDIRTQLYGTDHKNTANTYRSIGDIYQIMGDYGNALIYLDKALSIAVRDYGPNHPFTGVVYNSMGLVHKKMHHYDLALGCYQRAYEITAAVFGEDNDQTANRMNNIGVLYLDIGDHEKGLEYLKRTLPLWLKQYGEEHSMLAILYNNMGNAYREMADYNSALECLNRSMAIWENISGGDHPGVANCHNNQALVYLKKGEYGMALWHVQKAVVCLVPDFHNEDVYVNPPIHPIQSDIYLLNALKYKAEIFYQQYLAESHGLRDVQAAFDTYRVCSDLIDKMRIGYSESSSKLSLLGDVTEIFDKAIRTSLILYNHTHDMFYEQQALHFAEKARCSVLFESLQESRARHFSFIPDSLLDHEEHLRIELTDCDTEIKKLSEKKEKADSIRMVELHDRFFFLNTRYHAFIDRLETEYPGYYRLKYKTQTPSVGDIQGVLNENAALVEYFVGDTSLVIFALTRDKFKVVSLPVDSLFTKQVDSLVRSIKKVDATRFPEYSYRMYKILIQPVETTLRNTGQIIIIPHGVLCRVPFEALITRFPEKQNMVNFSDYRYLIKDMDISYHYSAALYMEHAGLKIRNKPVRHPAGEIAFLGFAPVFKEETANGYMLESRIPMLDLASAEPAVRSISVDGKHFNALNHSENEVREIVRLFERHGRKATGYFHAQASEDNFKSAVHDCQYVHIATHGLICEDSPELSGIIFSQPENAGAGEDGILFSGETYNLDLNADLVVLSSCESGMGKLMQGEGMMALTRGFLSSGASNIVVSLWKVDDLYTSRFMTELYKRILDGKSYSESLSLAKRILIRNPETAFPKLWSAFVLIGL